MITTSEFSCVITPSNPAVPLGLEILLDGYKIFDQEHVAEAETFKKQFSDQPGEHVLQFVLKNKLRKHTQLDANNNIVSDASIRMTDIMFEGVDVTYMVSTMAEYQHNFNGHGADTTDQFYGEMGCNGTVTVKFTTPIYLWLLEKM